MATPIVFFSKESFSKSCGDPFEEAEGAPLSKASKIVLGLAITDAFVSLTCLVLGILGTIALIGMPPAAAYSLISGSGVIILLWIIMLIKAHYCPSKPQKLDN